MSDFLQSIRNQSKDKRYQHNHQSRRPYDHNNGGHSNHHHNQQNHHNNQQQYQNNQNNNNYHHNHHRNNNDNQNNYHRNNDNRRYHQRPRNDYAQKDENLGLIKDLLETMVTQQNQAMEIHERRAIAEERKAEAIEEIASIISSLAGAEFPTIDKVVSGIDAVAREYEDELGLVDDEPMDDLPEQEAAPAAEMSKDEIIGMIHKMRAQGSTYNEVAAHLTELGLPTFSGRGKWHAQTIHRLCQQEG